VLLPRVPARDAFIAFVEGPTRVAAGDTVRLRVGYGAAGPHGRDGGGGTRSRRAVLAVSLGGRRLASRTVTVPDSGTLVAELAYPAARLPVGFTALDVRLEGVGDDEPRDDARLTVVEVSAEPAAVVLAAPPTWETRFFTQALEDVGRMPLRAFVQLGDSSGDWRDARTLARLARDDVARAVRGAQLVVYAGAPPPGLAPPPLAAVLVLPAGTAEPGDWYVRPPDPSPLAGPLAEIDWSALAPATGLAAAVPGAEDVVALSVAAARRGAPGAPRPAVVLGGGGGGGGRRRATIAAAGLWRWQFRGGASAVAYRTLVAALVDWLLGGDGAAARERAVPESRVVPNGLALAWRWAGSGEPRDLPLRLEHAAGGRARTDTLRFDAAGRAELRLPPGVYRYAHGGEPARRLVAVETYSDEWRPRPVALGAQAGAPAGRTVSLGMRDRWWLFVVAVLAFVGEWAWRRRQGLP
jgi:hypothetical protein